jgi:hypothetical protein
MNEPYAPEQTEAIRFFLRECQGARQPRYRVLRCAEELAKVPIQEIAKIAAMLVPNPASVAAKEGLPEKGGDDEKPVQGKATTQKRVNQENPLVVDGEGVRAPGNRLLRERRTEEYGQLRGRISQVCQGQEDRRGSSGVRGQNAQVGVGRRRDSAV